VRNFEQWETVQINSQDEILFLTDVDYRHNLLESDTIRKKELTANYVMIHDVSAPKQIIRS